MNRYPLISIIIPTYNRAHLIGETLDSVLAQTYTNWECIVVDDGSTDDTDEILKKYLELDSRFKYYLRPEEHLPGGNGARNYGFKRSKGEYIQWFDSDDLMATNFLEEKISHFSASIDFLISAGWYLFTDDSKERIRLSNTTNLYKDYVLWNIYVFTPSILFKRDFLANKELFNEDILKGQESEFFSRLFYTVSHKNFKLLNVPLFYYRRHSSTKSELDKAYRPLFKFSTAKNHLVNLKRAIELEDLELTIYFYKKSLKIYYSAYDNRDEKTYLFVIKKFRELFKSKHIIFYLKLKYFVHISRINKKLSIRLFDHLRYNLPQINGYT